MSYAAIYRVFGSLLDCAYTRNKYSVGQVCFDAFHLVHNETIGDSHDLILAIHDDLTVANQES